MKATGIVCRIDCCVITGTKEDPERPAAALRVLLYNENHSLGEWFKKSLLAIMQKEKLPLL